MTDGRWYKYWMNGYIFCCQNNDDWKGSGDHGSWNGTKSDRGRDEELPWKPGRPGSERTWWIIKKSCRKPNPRTQMDKKSKNYNRKRLEKVKPSCPLLEKEEQVEKDREMILRLIISGISCNQSISLLLFLLIQKSYMNSNSFLPRFIKEEA